MDMEKINEDPLFLALTRPAMIWGIPMEAFAISCGSAGLAMIAADSIFYLLLTLPFLAMSRFIVQRDQNAFRILFRWFDTGARCLNHRFWGGSSSSALRLKRDYRIEEID
ncbi:type IV secretion system protein VirB3 [Leisingera sp. JC1]|uniref:type IV secretion system protein VirB3 n=1 Tax=Leisingera sp. JC1 TaxID=1855282 RepID=UPI0008030591|nr:type IV secretion system protein VirB3 [Leisingera sp. JC1]OBY25169.1 hypothetical protein A9D60_22815 [Leisingera sp. JC1]